jgi:hybrid cluster-associated redox disulfide protein
MRVKMNKKNKKQNGKAISKKMSFAEIMEKHPEAIEALMEKGMHCCGCPMAMQETLEQGAAAHGLDADEIVEELNKKKRK